MIEYNNAKSPTRIIIPVSGQEEATQYQLGLLGILGEIELRDINPVLQEDIKTVYNLLKHMQSEDNPEQLLEIARHRRNVD